MSKSRDISIYTFLQALQEEYICLEIRSKIYLHKGDRDYFKGRMELKKDSIETLARKNRLKNIFNNQQEYLKVWHKIVPEFGLPRFIYNIINVSEKQKSFPYKGTAIEIDGICYGVTYRVNFQEQTVSYNPTASQDLKVTDISSVRRLTYQETDEYFYYYPDNRFNTIQGVSGNLQKYNIKTKQAILDLSGVLVTLRAEDISRIL